MFGFGGGVGSELCNMGRSNLATIPGFDSSNWDNSLKTTEVNDSSCRSCSLIYLKIIDQN